MDRRKEDKYINGKPLLWAPEYFINEYGLVWTTRPFRSGSKPKIRELKPHLTADGYLRLTVRLPDGTKKMIHIHQFMCEVFHGKKPTEKHEVRHIDGNKLNNSPFNLVWGTRSENALDRVKHGTHIRAYQSLVKYIKQIKGIRNPICKRGHNKNGKRSCSECAKITTKAKRGQND